MFARGSMFEFVNAIEAAQIQAREVEITFDYEPQHQKAHEAEQSEHSVVEIGFEQVHRNSLRLSVRVV
jgi:hypothetical protein